MRENRAYSLKAPGAPGSGSSLRLPGHGSFPAVDDRLVVPLTRDEIIGGRRVVASPANPPHALQHGHLYLLVRTRVASGYLVAVDLLTRHDVDSDFATDVCVYKDGADPETGKRYLEEIAFEVVSEQNEGLVTEKAVRMHRRGVRRIFSVWVKGRRRVCEWSSESQSWRPLEAGFQIEDPCLVAPLAVDALLDAAGAVDAMVDGLAAQGNPALLEREAAAEAKGRAEDVLAVLEARGIAVSATQRREIQDCRDLDRLGRWLRRAALAPSADEVTSEP